MQLLIILALLLYGGKSNAGKIFAEVKPVLESIGGEEMKEAIKNAEELSSVISAVREMAGDSNSVSAVPASGFGSGSSTQTDNGTVNFPLAPISNIADKDITYSLSRYIAQA